MKRAPVHSETSSLKESVDLLFKKNPGTKSLQKYIPIYSVSTKSEAIPGGLPGV